MIIKLVYNATAGAIPRNLKTESSKMLSAHAVGVVEVRIIDWYSYTVSGF